MLKQEALHDLKQCSYLCAACSCATSTSLRCIFDAQGPIKSNHSINCMQMCPPSVTNLQIAAAVEAGSLCAQV